MRSPYNTLADELKRRCWQGFAIYRERFQPCGFVLDGKACISTKISHGMQHRLPGAQRAFHAGTFDDRLFSRRAETALLGNISSSFIAMYEELYCGEEHNAQKPSLAQISGYRTGIIGHERDYEFSMPGMPLSDHFTRPSDLLIHAKSNKSCFACLQAAPDHFLPCGHGYCPDCIKDFGEPKETYPYHYEVSRCAMCSPYMQLAFPSYVVGLDPRAAGIRMLALDEGGIRSIIQLEVLHRVLDKVNLDLDISELFDFIAGTGTGKFVHTRPRELNSTHICTGGIVALGLASLPNFRGVFELTRMFRRLATETFKRDRPLVTGLLRSNYSSFPLETALRQAFGEDRPLFGPSGRHSRVAVYAVSSNSLFAFTNYNRSTIEADSVAEHLYFGARPSLVRAERPGQEAKIWEA